MDFTKIKGLSSDEVSQSRERYGCNVLTPPKKESLLKKFLQKFKDPLIVILMIAGALSIGISIYEYVSIPDKGFSVFFEPIGIFAAIFLATGLGFIFEVKADKEFAILNQVNDDEPVKVLRDGCVTEVPKRDVVVGDIVYLSTGEEIPADGQLLEAISMMVDESSLTGEPACHKSVHPDDFDPEATYATDRVLRGTNILEGHGICRIDKVGDATENGKVFKEAQIDNSVKTPLNIQLEGLGGLISKISYSIALLVIVGRCIMYYFDPHFASFLTLDFGAYLLESVMIAVALVVVSVPEGLPMAVTVSLAYSMRRLLKSNNLVRKMHACETMGATTVICTDKTGTLTQNRMQVAEADFFGRKDMLPVYEGIAVNTTAQLDLSANPPKPLGNPTEGALLLWLRSKGEDYRELKERAEVVAELPFSTERKYMATIVRSRETGRLTLYVKGAPEILLGLCSLLPASRESIEEKLLEWQRRAMRTLAFASQELESADSVFEEGHLHANGLAFTGIVAISDPVRTDVPEAVRECRDAGIAIKIVTGDTPATAAEIGRQIGLITPGDDPAQCIVTGPDVAAMTDDELTGKVGSFKIIARARPTDKKRLVEALQRNSEVVAVTGDGTNDAPALNAANVGLSMGDGTSVAKEASDITIIDNSFASIGKSVMWGRSLYRNIQRFILFQMTVNVAACLIVLAGSFMGTESPLTVTQMLWVNLIMDTFAAMALASLPPTPAVMKDKPRNRNDFIINAPMWQSIIGVGLVFFFFLLGLLYIFEHADVRCLTDLWGLRLGPRNPLTTYELSLFFTVFVFLQFWNMFNARAFMTGRSAFELRDCGEFLLLCAIIAGGQVLIVSFGGAFFNVTPLKAVDWGICVGVTSLVLWIGELLRLRR